MYEIHLIDLNLMKKVNVERYCNTIDSRVNRESEI